MGPEQRTLELARGVGFDLAGLAPLAPPPDAERFERWLALGRHADMDWFARQRERILDPSRILPSGKSLLVLGLAHSRAAVELPGGGRVARYAAGRDYHNLIGRLLRKLARRLAAEGLVDRSRAIVDAGPLLERSHAAVAGLGVPSKAANLLHPRFGPWFFLAELVVDAELEPTPAPEPVGERLVACGSCTACIDACPTAAIVAPGEVDARRCISYLTIENRGPVPRELRARIGPWAFGCDVCSEVCPWGHDAPDLAERFGLHPGIADPAASEPASHSGIPGSGVPGLIGWLELGSRFSERLNGSPLQRPKREGLARNAALTLASLRSDAGRKALVRALAGDPSPVVRAACGWALGHGHRADAGIREALEAAHAREPDPAARADLRLTLDEEA